MPTIIVNILDFQQGRFADKIYHSVGWWRGKKWSVDSTDARYLCIKNKVVLNA